MGLADTPQQNLNMTLSNSERRLELSREEREEREKREKVGGLLEEEVSASDSSNRLSELAAANEAHEAELQALLFQSALLQPAPIREGMYTHIYICVYNIYIYIGLCIYIIYMLYIVCT